MAINGSPEILNDRGYAATVNVAAIFSTWISVSSRGPAEGVFVPARQHEHR
jgi:hypothetical protein